MQAKPLFFLLKKGVEMIRLVTKHLDNVEVDTLRDYWLILLPAKMQR